MAVISSFLGTGDEWQEKGWQIQREILELYLKAAINRN
jgi:hypothetical protein